LLKPKGAAVPVTRRRDDELPAALRHDADAGPVVMPGYTLLNRGDWERLIDHIDGKIAWERRKRADPDDEGVTLDELAEKHEL
jgi:hypothetical protein